MKFDQTMVNNYISGEDVEGFEIEELEDNSQFMFEVLQTTMDKRCYNLCSLKVKQDYEFVKKVINLFKHDEEFICTVANNYLSTSNDELLNTELLIVMCSLIDKNGQNYVNYRLKLVLGSINDKLQAASLLNYVEKNNITGLKSLSEFWLTYDSSSGSPIVTNYYAKEKLDEIISENYSNLEQYIHHTYGSLEKFDKIGIRTFILDLIEKHDSTLSSYLSTNVSLLDDLVKRIKAIKDNWDCYEQEIEEKRYGIIIDVVNDYIEYHSKDLYRLGTEVVYLIGEELGITDKLLEYNPISEKDYNSIMKFLHQFGKKSELTIEELQEYNYLKKRIVNILSQEDPVELGDTFDDESSIEESKPNDNVVAFPKRH